MRQYTFLCADCGGHAPPDRLGRPRRFCAACALARQRAVWRRYANRPDVQERAKARRRERYRTEEAFAEERREAARRYRATYPERKAAQNAVYQAKAGWAPQSVYQAVKAGKLVKQPCAVCGDDRVHAHHHRGYEGEALYDVVWLCALHHKEAERH